MGMWTKVAVMITALVVLGACVNEAKDDVASKPEVSPQPARPQTDTEDYEGLWKLVEGSGPEGDVPAEEWDITGHIEGKRIFGTTGCNDFYGRIKVIGTTISILRIGATEEGCGQPEAEGPYLAAMFAATEIARRADQLILTGPDTRLVFQAVPPPPVNKLVGRRWYLTRVLDARFSEAFRSVRPHGDPPSFLMTRDGAWEAATACRRLEGRWIVEGDRIRSTESSALGGVRRCTDAASEQEGLIGSAFSEGFASVLQGKKLTIASDWGQYRLVYRTR